MCNEIHAVPSSGVGGFVSPLPLLNLVAKLRKEKEKENPIRQDGLQVCCDDDNTAGYRCIDCNLVYCEDCINGSHATKRSYKGHKVVSLEEYKNTTTTTTTSTTSSTTPHSRIIRHCTHHKDEEVKLFCIQDQTLICPYCISTIGKHAQHKCLPVKEASMEISKSTEELEKQINKTFGDMMKLKQQLVEQSEEYKKV